MHTSINPTAHTSIAKTKHHKGKTISTNHKSNHSHKSKNTHKTFAEVYNHTLAKHNSKAMPPVIHTYK